MLDAARAKAFKACTDIRCVGVERDVVIGSDVMESTVMAVCLFLAAYYSTNASVQSAVVVHSSYCFIGAFEFHHTQLLA
eukprot:3653426-Pleurochrysis_carterae.AAC.1